MSTKEKKSSYKRQYFFNLWRLIFGVDANNDKIDMHRLQDACVDGSIATSRLRSVGWRLLFDILPPEIRNWQDVIKETRRDYIELKLRYNSDIHNDEFYKDIDVSLMHPLSQNKLSPWFQKHVLRQKDLPIHQDVERTFPEMIHFKTDFMQKVIFEVLHVYANVHEDLGYRQGMHEIVAPILYSIYTEATSYQQIMGLRMLTSFDDSIIDTMNCLFDERFIEHDTYALFTAVMKTLRVYYLSSDCKFFPTSITPTERRRKFRHDVMTKKLYVEESELDIDSEYHKQLRHIHRVILSAASPIVQDRLEKLNIQLSTFAPRWLRVLFGREFSNMKDLLRLWDVLFAFRDGNELQLVKYVYVALIIDVYDILLASNDQIRCMEAIRSHSNVMTVDIIIQLAMALKWPRIFAVPKEYRNYVANGSVTRKSSISSTEPLTAFVTSQIPTSSSMGSSMSVSANEEEKKTITKSSSLFEKLKVKLQFRRNSGDDNSHLNDLARSTFYYSPTSLAVVNQVETNHQMVLKGLEKNELSGLLIEQLSKLQNRLNNMEGSANCSIHQLNNCIITIEDMFEKFQQNIEMSKKREVAIVPVQHVCNRTDQIETSTEEIPCGNAQSTTNCNITDCNTSEQLRFQEIALETLIEMKFILIRDINDIINKLRSSMSTENINTDELEVEHQQLLAGQSLIIEKAAEIISSSSNSMKSVTISPLKEETLDNFQNITPVNTRKQPIGKRANAREDSDVTSIQECQPTAGRFYKAEKDCKSRPPTSEGPISNDPFLTGRSPTKDELIPLMQRKTNLRDGRDSPPPNGSPKSLSIIRSYTTENIFGGGIGEDERIAEAQQDLVSDPIQPVERRASTFSRAAAKNSEATSERRRNF